MVLSVFLHMARVFYHGAYKAPREFNWVIGVILLTLTLLLSFTGYLLPWDQLALRAVTVGTDLRGYRWLVGDEVRFVLAGEGIFDIRAADGRWMRVAVEAGDLIVVPADLYHRFFLTERQQIRCVRLFKDAAGWVPEYRVTPAPAAMA